MGNAVVLYNSRGGNTEKVARKIAEGLGAESFNHKNIPNLDKYELLVVGSWVIMGRISFAGARYLKKLTRKNNEGKKVVLFFTSGAPDERNPMGDQNNPRLIKEIMFDSMEKILTKTHTGITILQDRFYVKGATRVFKRGKPQEPRGHPSEEELAQAYEFGRLLTQLA